MPLDLVESPLPVNFVLPSTANVQSLPPPETTSWVPDTDFTVPLAFIVLAVDWPAAWTAIGCAAMDSTRTESATIVRCLMSPPRTC